VSLNNRLAIFNLLLPPSTYAQSVKITQDVHQGLMFPPSRGRSGRWHGCSSSPDEILWLLNCYTTYFEVAFDPKHTLFPFEFIVVPDRTSSGEEGRPVHVQRPARDAVDTNINTTDGSNRVRVTIDASQKWVWEIPFGQRSEFQVVILGWGDRGDVTVITVEAHSKTLFCQRGTR
jgi:hypothetical protein